MDKNSIAIDIGYGACKILYDGKLTSFPTAISFHTDNGVKYGQDSVYEFEGEQYYVGDDAVSAECFTTTDFKFLLKYAPLIIYHILKKFDGINLARPVELRTGLSLSDWDKRTEFAKRIENFEVNGEKVSLNVSFLPQGAGILNAALERYPELSRAHVCIIDIGMNTINYLVMKNGKPIRSLSASYPGHGAISMIKALTSFMENKYGMSFSNTELIRVFVKEEFKYGGVFDEEVAEKVKELKRQLILRIFQSVLVNEKKSLNTADAVVISGGGAHILASSDQTWPANTMFLGVDENDTVDAIYANVYGYSLV